MLSFLHFLSEAGVPKDIWEEYYGPPGEKYTTIESNEKHTISQNFFLLSSNFFNFTSNVIDCSISSIKFLHSICTYTNITRSSGYGGCIYFYGNSSIVQDRFCSINCFSTGNRMHSYTDTRKETNKNFVNLSSLYQCGHDYTGGSSIFHNYGEKTLISTNNTNTKSFSGSGYSFLNNPVNINFCCFISNDNHETSPICMCHMNTIDSFVKKSIFKNNSVKADGTSLGLLSLAFSSNVTVIECIFLENNANHTFDSNFNSVLTIINCIGDLSATNVWGHKANTDKMKTDSFNLSLSLLSLGKCEAEHPFSFEFPLFISKIKRKIHFRLNFSFSFLIIEKQQKNRQ